MLRASTCLVRRRHRAATQARDDQAEANDFATRKSKLTSIKRKTENGSPRMNQDRRKRREVTT
jgi:hypothetical protein